VIYACLVSDVIYLEHQIHESEQDLGCWQKTAMSVSKRVKKSLPATRISTNQILIVEMAA
jgi:hypothetical protein